MSKERLLHVYSQVAWHSDVHIIGNRAALESLYKAIEEALASGMAESKGMASDGEHFTTKVILEDSPWDGRVWSNLGMPYLADYAADNRSDSIWPAHLEIEKRSQSDDCKHDPREE